MLFCGVQEEDVGRLQVLCCLGRLSAAVDAALLLCCLSVAPGVATIMFNVHNVH
jgi:hypothetical protein